MSCQPANSRTFKEDEVSGWAPTVSGGTAGLAVAVGLLGGIGTLIGIIVDRRHLQTAAAAP